eukprot:g10862.t1
MARKVVLTMCLKIAPAMSAWGDTVPLTGPITRNLTASDQVSSLGYPCYLEEFQRAGYAPAWNSCDEPHELVFLHAPKTAGESVEAALDMEKNHQLARERRDTMGEEAWGCAFKFSVARNPWARWESWYSFCNSGYGPELVLPKPRWGCKMARSMTLSSWTKNIIVILLGLQALPPGLSRHLSEWGAEFEASWWFGSQSEYVTDGEDLNKLLPNFIIRFENLESDFDCMTTLLGLPVDLGHRNPSIAVEGKSTAERVAAFDQEARELIAAG